MELQLVAHVATNEEGVSASIKQLTNEARGYLMLQVDSNRVTVSIKELKEAITKLEDFNNETTTEQESED